MLSLQTIAYCKRGYVQARVVASPLGHGFKLLGNDNFKNAFGIEGARRPDVPNIVLLLLYFLLHFTLTGTSRPLPFVYHVVGAPIFFDLLLLHKLLALFFRLTSMSLCMMCAR